MLRNIPMRYTPKNLRQLLPKLNLPEAVKVKKAPGWDYAFLTFASTADQQAAILGLTGYEAYVVIYLQLITRNHHKGCCC